MRIYYQNKRYRFKEDRLESTFFLRVLANSTSSEEMSVIMRKFRRLIGI